MLCKRRNTIVIAIAIQVAHLHYYSLVPSADLFLQGTHARTQGIIKGVLIVPDDLPKHLKQFMFEHEGEHVVVCRYSSEPGDLGLDVRICSPSSLLIKHSLTH